MSGSRLHTVTFNVKPVPELLVIRLEVGMVSMTHKDWIERTGLNYPPDTIFSDDYYRFALSTVGLNDIRVTGVTDEDSTFWVVLISNGCEVFRFTQENGVLQGYRKVDEFVKNYTKPDLSKKISNTRW